MAESGGSSTVGGVGYENWYFALQMVHLLVNENNTTTITPQKVREDLSLDEENFKRIYIDDLVIDSEGIKEHYTIKRQSNGGVWNIAQLKSEGVIQAIKNQFESTPDRQIKFVSKSDSPIIREFERIKQASSRDEVIQILSKDLLKQWDELKKELEYDDNKLLQLSKKIQIRQIDEESIKDSIDSVFSAKFNAPKTFKDTLLSYAMERSVSKLSTSRKDILDHLSRQGIYEKSTLSYNEIIKDLRSASASLTSSKSLFQFEHIERVETKSILNWIKSDKQSKILTVVGGAGTGKTTVLQDVLETLTRDGIPVLAIKTDKIGFSNSEELRSSLNLPDTVERIFTKLSEETNYSILLLDQIDVLSYYLSSDRAQLHRYKELISKLEKLENVLIIISCRTFDLNNELELNQYKTNQTIEVLNFSTEQVRKIIANSNIDITRISKETLKLLENPLNLTIFIGLYKNNGQEVLNITTLQELYHELWKRIILKNEKRETIADLIFQISQDIYEQQSLTVGRSSYELKYNEELNFLLSNNIIQESSNSISFFHQTFFDYSLARNFINSNKSISNEILNGIQGLFQRPRVKAILDYLYHENRSLFFQECHKILFDPNYRIHFKYLIINIIGSIKESHKDLFAIADQIFQDENLKIPFIKSILSDELIKWYTNEVTLDLTDKTTYETFFHLCFANSNTHANSVINLIRKYESELERHRLVYLLPKVGVIQNIVFIEFYEKYKKDFLSNHYLYESILNKAIEQNEFEFVYKELCSYYDNVRNYSVNIKQSYLSSQYKSIIQKVCEEDIDMGYEIVKKLFFDTCEFSEAENIFNYKSIPCLAYENFYGIPPKLGEDKTVYFLYEQIINYLSDNKSKLELDDFLSSKYSIIKCAGLEALCKVPEVFFDKGFDYIFGIDGIINDFPKEDELLKYLIGESIRSIHPYLELSNQMVVYEKCMSLKDKCVWISWHSGKKMRNTELFIDRYQLISKIPRNFIDSNSYMKRQFQEFERRFGSFEWKRPKEAGSVLSSGSIPLPEKAYQSMSLQTLKESFLRVGLIRRFENTNATKHGHADTFKKMCTENPYKYKEFVQQLIEETKHEDDPIVIYALYGFLGIHESNINKKEVTSLLHIILNKHQSFHRYEYQTSLIIQDLAQINEIDTVMFQYMIDVINQSCKTANENKRFTYYINTVFYLFGSGKFQNYTFNCTESWSSGVNELLKLHILSKIAQLNIIDKNRSLSIFCKIMEDISSLDKYKYARASIQYMMNIDIEPIKLIINQAIEEVVDEDTQEWYGQLIGNLWCYSFKDSHELLFLSTRKSHKYKEGVLSFCINLIFGEPDTYTSKEKAYKIIEEYLSDENEMMYANYQKFIRETNSNNFLQHKAIIEKYINSNIRKVQFRLGALNAMLFRLAAKYPNECINLCELDINSNYFSNQFLDNTSQKKTFDILVKAYNSLSSFTSDEFRTKTLDIIDQALEIAIEHQTYDLNKTFDILSQNEA